MFKQLIALFACLSLVACASTSRTSGPVTRVVDPGSAAGTVRAGDVAEIRTKDGKDHGFRVTKVTNTALYGKTARVAYDDMVSLEITRTVTRKGTATTEDPGYDIFKTLILGPVGVVLTLVLIREVFSD